MTSDRPGLVEHDTDGDEEEGRRRGQRGVGASVRRKGGKGYLNVAWNGDMRQAPGSRPVSAGKTNKAIIRFDNVQQNYFLPS